MPNPVVHFEIGCQNVESTVEFYKSLFDWKIEPHGPAQMISTGGEHAITGHITSLGHEPHNFVNVYVKVDDIESYIDKAKSLGGKLIVGPIPIPTGSFAWIADPEGTMIALFRE
jgi:predicted enzyme related to lactoylglutathione lyase